MKTSQRRPSAATELAQLVDTLGIELLRSEDDEIFCRVPVNGHHEIYPLDGERMIGYLSSRFYVETGKVIPPNSIKSVLPLFQERALNQSEAHRVNVRVGGSIAAGRVYIDLANSAWEAVEIDAAGWRIITNPPVLFHRPAGIGELPCPIGGSIDRLRPLLNCGSEENFKLLVGFLLGSLRPEGPYPVLVLQGSEGSGKSTLARYLIRLIDPQAGELRKPPKKDPASLFVAAKSSWLQAYDNLSTLSGELSDDLCRLSTGGGSAERALFTNDEVHRYSVERPVILTAITSIISRSDLRERSIILTLSKPARVTEEAALNAQFILARPAILGALCEAVSMTIRQQKQVILGDLPRLADFARWVEGAAPALGWGHGEIVQLFSRRQSDTALEAIAEDPVAEAIKTVVKEKCAWQGCSRELLYEVNGIADLETKSARGWPQTPRDMTNYLTRKGTELQRAGIMVEKGQHAENGIIYTLTLARHDAEQPADKNTEAPNREEPVAEGQGQETAEKRQHSCVKCAERLPEGRLKRIDVRGGDFAWVCPSCEPKVKGVIRI